MFGCAMKNASWGMKQFQTWPSSQRPYIILCGTFHRLRLGWLAGEWDFTVNPFNAHFVSLLFESCLHSTIFLEIPFRTPSHDAFAPYPDPSTRRDARSEACGLPLEWKLPIPPANFKSTTKSPAINTGPQSRRAFPTGPASAKCTSISSS